MQIFLEDKKWCNSCKEYKNFDEFYKSTKKSGISSNCKICSKASKQTQEYKDKANKRRKEKYCSDNKFREEILKSRSLYRKTRIPEIMLSQAKIRSKQSGLEFNIAVDDIIIPEFCPILNIKLKQGKRGLFTSPSLDRIDPSKGYIKGNVAVISILANMMKNKATPEQVLLFCENMPKYMQQINYDIVRTANITEIAESEDKEPQS